MRRSARWSVLAAVAVFSLAGAAPALAGSGGGGVCSEEPPVLDVGWVAVGDNCFAPTEVEIATGNAVRWEAFGQILHTVTFDTGPDAGTIPRDGLAVQFNSPGTYGYFCSFHNGMVGTINAVGSAVGGPALEILGSANGAVSTSGGRATQLQDGVVTRLEFSPLAAAIILAVGLPLSLGLTLRLVGFARSPTGYRLRLPWESTRAPEPAAARRPRR